MKNFYSWYKKHITTAIFIGLILGILLSLLCYQLGMYKDQSDRKHLHECPEHDDLSTGILFNHHGYLQYRKCPYHR